MRFMLAKEYDGRDIAGYLVAEKLDGVRAYWTGTALISRNGLPFRVPRWFMDRLPADVALDGELYGGRGTLGKTVGALRTKTPIDAEWRKIRFMVFDAPRAAGGFEDRAEVARTAVSGSSVAAWVEHSPITGRAELEARFLQVVEAGGEGLMLRRAGSAYEPHRTDALLKVKERPAALLGA